MEARKSVAQIQNYFNRESMHKVLLVVLNYIIGGYRKVSLKLNIGGGSYTGGQQVVVGLSEEFFSLSFKEMYVILTALLGHEAQHVLSSNFDDFGTYIDEESDKLIKKGYNRQFAQKIVHSTGNIIEDGRIERILSNKLQGFVKKLQFLNIFYYNLNVMDGTEDNLTALMSAMLTLTKLGVYPKGYTEHFVDTEVDKEVDKIKHLIARGVVARTCKDGLNICREILETIEPFLRKEYEEAKAKMEQMEKFMETLQELIESSNFSDSTESEKNEKPGKGKENKSIQLVMLPTEAPDEEEEADGEGQPAAMDDGNLATNLSEGKEGSGTGDRDRAEDLSESIVAEQLEKISQELMDDAEVKIAEVEKIEKNRPKDVVDDKALTAKEAREFKGNGRYDFLENPVNFPLDYDLPAEIKVPAKKFRKEVEKIFKNKAQVNVHGQVKGALNVEDLHRVSMSDHNIFTVEGSKSTSDHVAYILQDGSGSMHGEKELNSSIALSILEEGLKGIIPFKMVTFTVGYGGIVHHVVKNWNDKDKKNYAHNYLKHKSCGGGNEDDLSINVATIELLKRPEKDKLLIVLSDGLPSSTERVKQAVKDARAKGIHVVGIMFGDTNFRSTYYESYKNMYEKNIIATSPSHIPAKLTETLKKVLSR